MNRSLLYRYAMPQNRCERFLPLEIFLDGSHDGSDSHHATRCRAANREAAETCRVIGAEHAASGHKKAPSLFRSPVTLDVEKLMAASGVQIKDARKEPADSIRDVLSYLSFAYGSAAQSLYDGDDKGEARWLSAAESFKTAHFDVWAKAFMEKTIEETLSGAHSFGMEYARWRKWASLPLNASLRNGDARGIPAYLRCGVRCVICLAQADSRIPVGVLPVRDCARRRAFRQRHFHAAKGGPPAHLAPYAQRRIGRCHVRFGYVNRCIPAAKCPVAHIDLVSTVVDQGFKN